MDWPFVGFRINSAFIGGEFYTSQTCRYSDYGPAYLNEDERMCKKPGCFYELENRVIPACENHRDSWLSLYMIINNKKSEATGYETFPKAIEIADECCVCYGQNKLLVTVCFHVLCHSCYTKLPNKLSCPNCRGDISKFIRRLS